MSVWKPSSSISWSFAVVMDLVGYFNQFSAKISFYYTKNYYNTILCQFCIYKNCEIIYITMHSNFSVNYISTDNPKMGNIWCCEGLHKFCSEILEVGKLWKPNYVHYNFWNQYNAMHIIHVHVITTQNIQTTA